MRLKPGAPKSRANALSARPMSAADVIRGRAGGAGAAAVSGGARDAAPAPGRFRGSVVLAMAVAKASVSWRLAVAGLGAPDPVSAGGPAQEAPSSAAVTAAQWTGFVKERSRSGTAAAGRAFGLGGLRGLGGLGRVGTF